MGFGEDTRGVSELIGAVFVVFFVVILLSWNQAFHVPQQNKEVEFEHYQGVKEEMIGLGADTVTVAGRSDKASATVDLGVTFPNRFIAINPPPAAGSVAKRPQGNLSINLTGSKTVNTAELCGGGRDTFGIAYVPAYNELRTGDEIIYENGQVYINGTENDAILDSRTLIDTENNTIDIYRFSGPLPNESRVSPITIDFEGSELIGVNESADVDNVTYPSELSIEKWESDVIEGSVNDVTKTGGRVTIEIDDTDYTITCYTIGVGGESPPDDFAPKFQTLASGGGGGAINPAGSGSVQLMLENTSSAPGPNNMTMTFKNTGNRDVNITQARLSFYDHSQSEGDFEEASLINTTTGSVTARMTIGGDFVTSDPQISLPGNGTSTDIEIGFINNDTPSKNIQDSEFFVISFGYSNGDSAQYFVDAES